MFDYAAWVERARQFHAGMGSAPEKCSLDSCSIAPKLKPAALRQIEKSLRHSAPGPIQDFLTTASGDCSLRFVWEPLEERFTMAIEKLFKQNYLFGGAMLCHAASFEAYQRECVETVEITAIGQIREERDCWLNSFPFARLLNSDMLSIDLRNPTEGLPVLYLSHDESSRILSPSFDQFLQDWESLCYVGPEIWILEPFLDGKSNRLKATSRNAMACRKLFGFQLK